MHNTNLLHLRQIDKLFYNPIFTINYKSIKFLFFSDFLYRHSVTFDSVTTEVEIMDTSKCAVSLKLLLLN